MSLKSLSDSKSMSYYQRHKEELLAKQNAYHKENRNVRIAYMKEYNKKYYALYKPNSKPKEAKPPKEKKLKKPKPPKQPKQPKTQKIVKPKNAQEPTVPIYPTVISRGNFVLSFD